jgi:hypothetical protein
MPQLAVDATPPRVQLSVALMLSKSKENCNSLWPRMSLLPQKPQRCIDFEENLRLLGSHPF